jgi:hypothetical protein
VSGTISEEVLLSLQELKLSQRQLSLKVDALKTTELSISDAQIGDNTLKACKPEEMSGNRYDGPSMLTDDEALVLKGLKPENELVKYLAPKLRALVPEDSCQVLVNSEKHAWIETGLEPKFFRKPDMFVVLSSFWSVRGGEERKSDEGVLSEWKLRDGVAVLLEAKLAAKNEVIGQLVNGMRLLHSNEKFPWKRFGVALMSKEFFVLEFCGDKVYKIERCGWAEKGGLELLKKALSHGTFWSFVSARLCAGLGVKLVGDGKGFLGMGAFGRVVRCERTTDGKLLALKMVMGNEQDVKRLEAEFSSLWHAGEVCEDHVIKVKEIASSGEVGEGMFFCGYTMELGEEVDFGSLKVRGACLEALMQIHVSGWCHGDARAANVVKVKLDYKFVDFLLANHFIGQNGRKCVARDVTEFTKSLSGRVQKVSSSEAKLPRRLPQLIDEYAACFENAVIDKEGAKKCMKEIIAVMTSAEEND